MGVYVCERFGESQNHGLHGLLLQFAMDRLILPDSAHMTKTGEVRRDGLLPARCSCRSTVCPESFS